jgi:hypothetical protein
MGSWQPTCRSSGKESTMHYPWPEHERPGKEILKPALVGIGLIALALLVAASLIF